MSSMDVLHQRLSDLLRRRPGELYIAVSGGIDSLALMTVAARVRSTATIAIHAISEAVPHEATQRCERLAQRHSWKLKTLDAGEFNDPRYIENPLNRCYYCKTNLFQRISSTIAVTGSGARVTIATGTNMDDTGDFRPGLKAATEHDVWQPYVEAGIDKNTIRDIARIEGLESLAELPAQPCLASRVETGIAIDAVDLQFAHRTERMLAQWFGEGDIRCRITAQGVVAQLPADTAVFKDSVQRAGLEARLKAHCAQHGRSFYELAPYRMGSAFLK